MSEKQNVVLAGNIKQSGGFTLTLSADSIDGQVAWEELSKDQRQRVENGLRFAMNDLAIALQPMEVTTP